MRTKKSKSIDCVAMKRRIQEKLYAKTRDLSPAEEIAYYQRVVAVGPFKDLREKLINKLVMPSAAAYRK